jgi:ABC-type Mn2+/Zn2+ transport system ATPase subunit
VLRLEKISKIYPTGEVLREVTWEVKAGDRIGLVGVNGAGKSTQMRLIAGLEEPSSGQIVRQGNPRIAYLQQEFDVDLQRTVRAELFQAFGEAAEVRNRTSAVETEMASDKAAADPDHLEELIHELGHLHERFEALHGYELEARIDKLLPTIGFSPEGAEQLVADYSGGWQMRIALGKILLQEPDLLLLDEPTNHLDVATRSSRPSAASRAPTWATTASTSSRRPSSAKPPRRRSSASKKNWPSSRPTSTASGPAPPARPRPRAAKSCLTRSSASRRPSKPWAGRGSGFRSRPARAGWWPRSGSCATATASRFCFWGPSSRSSGATASPLSAPTAPANRRCCG